MNHPIKLLDSDNTKKNRPATFTCSLRNFSKRYKVLGYKILLLYYTTLLIVAKFSNTLFAKICREHSIVVLFMVLSFKLSLIKHCKGKILTAICKTFLYEEKSPYKPYRFSYKFG